MIPISNFPIHRFLCSGVPIKCCSYENVGSQQSEHKNIGKICARLPMLAELFSATQPWRLVTWLSDHLPSQAQLLQPKDPHLSSSGERSIAKVQYPGHLSEEEKLCYASKNCLCILSSIFSTWISKTAPKTESCHQVFRQVW